MTAGIVVRSTSVNHAPITGAVNPFNTLLQLPGVAGLRTAHSAERRAKLGGEIERQAALVSHLEVHYRRAATGLMALQWAFAPGFRDRARRVRGPGPRAAFSGPIGP